MIFSACSTKPSIQLIDPVSKVKKIKVLPPESATTECVKQLNYPSGNTREVIKIVLANNELYGICAGKMKSAVEYIKNLDD